MMIANWIKTQREQHGWTQEQLGEQLGYTPQHISLLERGERMLTVDILTRLSHLFSNQKISCQQGNWEVETLDFPMLWQESFRQAIEMQCQMGNDAIRMTHVPLFSFVSQLIEVLEEWEVDWSFEPFLVEEYWDDEKGKIQIETLKTHLEEVEDWMNWHFFGENETIRYHLTLNFSLNHPQTFIEKGKQMVENLLIKDATSSQSVYAVSAYHQISQALGTMSYDFDLEHIQIVDFRINEK